MGSIATATGSRLSVQHQTTPLVDCCGELALRQCSSQKWQVNCCVSSLSLSLSLPLSLSLCALCLRGASLLGESAVTPRVTGLLKKVAVPLEGILAVDGDVACFNAVVNGQRIVEGHVHRMHVVAARHFPGTVHACTIPTRPRQHAVIAKKEENCDLLGLCVSVCVCVSLSLSLTFTRPHRHTHTPSLPSVNGISVPNPLHFSGLLLALVISCLT